MMDGRGLRGQIGLLTFVYLDYLIKLDRNITGRRVYSFPRTGISNQQ